MTITNKKDLFDGLNKKNKDSNHLNFSLNLQFFSESDSALLPIYKDMIDQLNELNITPNPINKDSKPTKNIINIYLTSDSDRFKDFTGSDYALGCHCINSMPNFDRTEWDVNEHAVFIEASTSRFLSETKSILDDIGIYDDLYKSIVINNWFDTLTHEISHAIEFIECSDGLTPSEVSSHPLYDNFDCSTGFNLRDDVIVSNLSKETDKNAIIDLMEVRVELKSQSLLNKIDMDENIDKILPIIKKEKRKNTLTNRTF